MIETNKYCNSLTTYSKFITREVMVGNVGIGGNNPIRVQSMTTTDTMDTKASVEQSIRMIEAGCELVRLTAPSINEAKNLENIKKEIRARGYETPLVADIHFTPNAAEHAARIVEKVRVNPGNYADKKKFEHIEYTDASYEAELARIRKRFVPLVEICKEYGTAMRIGTNHGSLSDRILSRYGDTPLGMVESAWEFLEICESLNYHDIVISMKASNTQVMVQAYRLLVNKMMNNGKNYPLHLGVTEAGDGEDGRVKSSVGIGTLLEDGLGDTVRVSLTEEPEKEIPVARALVDRYKSRTTEKENIPIILPKTYSPFEYKKRESKASQNFGGENVPRVIADLSNKDKIEPANLFAFGYNYNQAHDKWGISDFACDYLYTGKQTISFALPGTLGVIIDHENWNAELGDKYHPLINLETLNNESTAKLNDAKLIFVNYAVAFAEISEKINHLPENAILVAHTKEAHGMAALRSLFFQLEASDIKVPVVVQGSYQGLRPDEFQLYASTDAGALFLDGFGDGIWLRCENVPAVSINQACFNILQATRTRISKTEYISCPSCGRTLFDLQETTAMIRSRTNHLKGVKIGIMGCIVNGPGEMADADYGYVGTGIGKITLYKGQDVVKRNIPSEEAVDELIELIKQHGDWVETPAAIS